jgi:Leu/Phe-tRNA-protein transferase
MYGIFAVETDAVPVILLCPDGRALLLPSGVKSAENLTTTIGQEC